MDSILHCKPHQSFSHARFGCQKFAKVTHPRTAPPLRALGCYESMLFFLYYLCERCQEGGDVFNPSSLLGRELYLLLFESFIVRIMISSYYFSGRDFRFNLNIHSPSFVIEPPFLAGIRENPSFPCKST